MDGNTTRPNEGKPLGVGTKAAQDNVRAPQGARVSAQRGSGAKTGQHRPTHRANTAKRPGNQKSSIADSKRDWRRSTWTTSVLGVVIVAGTLELVTKDWKVTAAFGIGIMFTLLMVMGGSDD